MWNDMIGEDVKHLEKVLPITPWTSMNLRSENGMIEKEKKQRMR